MYQFLFRVLYLGQNYQGFQRQLNGRTIENVLEFLFIKEGLIQDFNRAQYMATSRTDAGVSAISNYFTLMLDRSPNLRDLNNELPDDILLLSYAKVDHTFNPRHTRSKFYSYYLPKSWDSYGLERIYDFIGKHDFSQFIKNDGAGEDNPINTVYSIDVDMLEDFFHIKIQGSRFGREQVRKMVGFFLQKKHSNVSPLDFMGTTERYDLRAAPPEYLYLEKVEFDFEPNWVNTDNLDLFISRLNCDIQEKLNRSNFSKKLVENLIKQADVGQ